MYLIGLTGNIGAGKSTVARQLGELGASVLDADQVYRALMEPGQPAHAAVLALFGTVDRRKLGEIVFRDPAALRRLEQATHPLVRARVDEILAEADPRIAVYEAIKLIESGGADRCDELWVVTAPRELQIERLVRDRGMSPDDAALRVDAQPPQAEKVARADVVIENAGDLTALRRRVEREWARVAAKAAP